MSAGYDGASMEAVFCTMFFWIISVPGLINGRDQCWSECNKRDGKCDFCGSNGYCCRKGYNNNGCDGKIGGNDHHICVTYPGNNDC